MCRTHSIYKDHLEDAEQSSSINTSAPLFAKAEPEFNERV